MLIRYVNRSVNDLELMTEKHALPRSKGSRAGQAVSRCSGNGQECFLPVSDLVHVHEMLIAATIDIQSLSGLKRSELPNTTPLRSILKLIYMSESAD